GTQTMLLSGAIYPVYQLMEDYDIDIDWNDFVGSVLGYYTHEGNLYSLPFNSSTPIFFYNKDIFAAAGLDPEKPPTTWQEVEEYSKQIMDAGLARYGFTTGWPGGYLIENAFAWHGVPFASHGNGFESLNAELLINSEFGIEHVSTLARWQKEGVFNYGGRGDSANWIFFNEEAAMMMHSSALIGSMMQSDINWGAGMIPHWGDPYPKTNTIIGGATLWVMNGHKSEEYRGVAEFLNFVAQPEQQAWWHKQTGYVPISIPAAELLEAEGHFETNPYQRVAIDQLNYNEPTADTRGIRLGSFVQIRNIIEEELENIFGGSKSVENGLNDAVKRGNQLIDEFAEIYQ
ncbi:MAG TPA: sn-glycerol-3-phosphate ABC transporter substrate-binding protein, partial [Firmicutes bacterium]|nr:sn-glycerol-3-phosphate ABC transporter substrate-binding protein [Bacillota bacterium]